MQAAVVAARLTPGTVAEAGAPQPAPEAGAPAPVAPVPAAPPGLGIRRAGPGDLDAVVDLGMEVIRYDANFGGVTERPWTRSALTQDAARLLADAQPWVWLAERDGQPVGLVAAHAPEHAAWIAPMAGPSPVAYLYLGGVRAAHRAAGVGAALAARLAAETERHSRSRHAPALCPGQSAVGAILEPAGLPPALDGMGGPARDRGALAFSSR